MKEKPRRIFSRQKPNGEFHHTIHKPDNIEDYDIYIRADLVKNLVAAVEDREEFRRQLADWNENFEKLQSLQLTSKHLKAH